MSMRATTTKSGNGNNKKKRREQNERKYKKANSDSSIRWRYIIFTYTKKKCMVYTDAIVSICMHWICRFPTHTICYESHTSTHISKTTTILISLYGEATESKSTSGPFSSSVFAVVGFSSSLR